MKLYVSYTNNSRVFLFPGISKLLDEEKDFLIYYYTFPKDILYVFIDREIIIRDTIINRTIYSVNYLYTLIYIKEDNTNNLIIKLCRNKKINYKNYYTSLKHKAFKLKYNFSGNKNIYESPIYSSSQEELTILLLYEND